MDAISFVLGIQSAHLRSSKLKDLIFRNEFEDNEEEDNEDTENPVKARVTAVYVNSEEEELRFSRL
jgi:structural maintenance of chromosome 1